MQRGSCGDQREDRRSDLVGAVLGAVEHDHRGAVGQCPPRRCTPVLGLGGLTDPEGVTQRCIDPVGGVAHVDPDGRVGDTAEGRPVLDQARRPHAGWTDDADDPMPCDEAVELLQQFVAAHDGVDPDPRRQPSDVHPSDAERRIVTQHPEVRVVELRPGADPERVPELVAHQVEQAERLGLPTELEQRLHRVRRAVLAGRLPSGQLDHAVARRVVGAGEHDERAPLVLEPEALGDEGPPVVIEHVVLTQRAPRRAPPLHGGGHATRRGRRVDVSARPGVVDGCTEVPEVHAVRDEGIAVTDRREPCRARTGNPRFDRRPQASDVRLDRVRRIRAARLGVEALDEHGHADRIRRVCTEQRRDPAPLRAAQLDRLVVDDEPEPTEDLDAQHVHASPVSVGCQQHVAR